MYGSQRCCSHGQVPPCILYGVDYNLIITHTEISKLSSTCTVIPPLNCTYYDSGQASIHTPDNENILTLCTNTQPVEATAHSLHTHLSNGTHRRCGNCLDYKKLLFLPTVYLRTPQDPPNRQRLVL